MNNLKIKSIDETSGRVLISAPDVADGTSVAVFLDKQRPAWGTAKVTDELALVMGRGPLSATYSLRLVQYASKPKLLPPSGETPPDEAGNV